MRLLGKIKSNARHKEKERKGNSQKKLQFYQNKRCNEWPQAAKDAGMFCDTAGAKGCVNSYFKGYCSLSTYSSDLPSCECSKQFACRAPSQHLTLHSSRYHLCGLLYTPKDAQYFTDKTKGGQNQHADFCPAMSPYSNGDCRVSSNAPQYNYHGESYASASLCFASSLLQKGYVFSDQTLKPACYETVSLLLF